MNACSWLESSLDYARKLIDSGLQGAGYGRERFFDAEPLAPFVSQSARTALQGATVGACIGLLGSCLGRDGKRVRSLAYGALGGALGFGIGLVWGTRRFTSSVAHGVLDNVNTVRDEHWLEKNPIDYA
jgi:hypothetical protein